MAPSTHKTQTTLDWDVHSLADFLPHWLSAGDEFTASMTQHIPWVFQWQKHVNKDCICVVGRSDAKIVLILTLEIIKQGPLTVAIFPGGRHANENFPCLANSHSMPGTDECIRAVKSIVRTKRPDVDAVYLHRQVLEWDEMINPLLPVQQSTPTDIALSFAIDADFKGKMDAHIGSKKLKKIRQTGRRLEERGGWTYHILDQSDEAQEALTRFFTLKAKRLANKGIPNVFAADNVQAFLKSIFSLPPEKDGSGFEVHVLKVAGQIMAVTGNSRLGDWFNVEFTAVDDTESSVSHGEFLYYQMIASACDRGLRTFSFGVGDEPFKRNWCDIETAQYNTAIALTLKGRMAAKVESVKTTTIRKIKSNKRLYGFLKNLRKRTSTPAP